MQIKQIYSKAKEKGTRDHCGMVEHLKING